MKIYIAGKISGLPFEKVKKKFEKAEAILLKGGWEPISPLKVSPQDDSKIWEDYMEDCISALLRCHVIYMLKDWGKSKGARIEYSIARELELDVIFESEL